MCGRYYVDEDSIDMREMLAELDKRHSTGEIFPTNVAPVIKHDGIAAVKWGFPKWSGSGVIINARAETALEKNMFRKSMLERRCVIPCSGFYEWQHSDGKKKKDKYLLNHPGGGIMYLAGAFGSFRGEDGEYEAFVVLTTAANGSVAPIHDRMPVIIGRDEREAWVSDMGFMEHAMRRVGPGLEAMRL